MDLKIKIISFVKKYWREMAIVGMFLYLQSGITQAIENSQKAYDYAADAADYSRRAENYCSDASDYASQAADSASSCEYLQ
jgi:hypothetical protein